MFSSQRVIPIVLLCMIAANAALLRKVIALNRVVAQQIVGSFPRSLSREAFARIANDAPSIGPSNAPFTLVVFSDFQCPYCRSFARMISPLRSEAKSNIRIVFRNLPLARHASAETAAELAACARMQGNEAFWVTHDMLFSRDHLDPGVLALIEKQISTMPGLNSMKLESCVTGRLAKPLIDRDASLAAEVGAHGTPTIFINGREVSNPPKNLAELSQLMISP